MAELVDERRHHARLEFGRALIIGLPHAENAIEFLAASNLLSDEEYVRQRAGLLKEKAALEEMLRDAGQLVEKCLELSEKSFDFASTARDRFTKGDSEVKKEILAALGSNLVLKDKMLSIQALEPFFILENLLNGDEDGNEPIEPENIGMPQRRDSENDLLVP
jgi:hypothetical protein